jgi:phosphonate transport system substrate-binding protein
MIGSTPVPRQARSSTGRHRGLLGTGLLASMALLLGAGLSGCNEGQARTIEQDNGDRWPATLRVAYTPSSEDPEGRMTQYRELAGYLGDQLGIEVDLVRSSSYGPTIEAMRAHKIDLASGGPFSYIIASHKAGAEVLISRGKRDGSFGAYSTVIATSPDTGIRSIDDMRKGAAELTFAFVDPASSSGHLVPRGYLESIGLNPEKCFKQVVFAQNHPNTIMTAVSAKADVAAISRSALDRFIERGRIKADELVILWESDPIPSSPWYVRAELPDSLKLAVQQAFVRMEQQQPALLETFRQRVRDPDMVFLASDDTLFDPLRQIALGLDTMNLLN